MKITNKHQGASFKVPVIIDDKGRIMDYGDGVQQIRYKLGMSAAEFGAACGVSWRTVGGWEQGRVPAAASLIIMANLLAAAEVKENTAV